MAFEIKDKVALVTGGASGIGLECVKALLTNGLRGATIADVNESLGKQVLKEIEQEFGRDKVMFVKTDVTDRNSFEDAFKATVDKFKNVDILINNAGILDDSIWEKSIAVNINGVVHGTLLALENYLQKYRSGSEGVIVNVSSIAGTAPLNSLPVYSGTKFAIFGLSKAFGDEEHCNRTGVKVVIICPGITDTPLMAGTGAKTLGTAYSDMLKNRSRNIQLQNAEHVANGAIKVIQKAKTGTAWVIEDGQAPYEFPLVHRDAYAKTNVLLQHALFGYLYILVCAPHFTFYLLKLFNLNRLKHKSLAPGYVNVVS